VNRLLLGLLPLSLFIILALFLWRGLSINPHLLPSALIDKPAPELNLPLLQFPRQRLNKQALLGKPYLLNVWASWCNACRQEHSFLMRLAAKKQVTLIGFDYKDKQKDAKRWLQIHGNPYQKIVVDPQGLVAINWGVYGTPESFLIDAKGRIRYKHVGPLDENIWKRAIAPRLKQMTAEKEAAKHV
jgi:cytochrome c biogenesis protein CcmG, thiol:disulfide interchange protein DsbE